MKRVLVVCLLLQVVCAARNISISFNTPAESPADVSYVEGSAPDELKAGPVKNETKLPETIAKAAFIRSFSREIPKDDEIENEEFERFIEKHYKHPTIETVFVSSSPATLSAEESEESNEESSSSEPQAEVFKRPAQLRTYERNVAHPLLSSSILPPTEHQQAYTYLNHQPHEEHFTAYNDGQYVPVHADSYNGGEQQYYHISQGIPSHFPHTFNVAQNALKTKTYEIRRPAIQKHYYDIEERVIIRPAGSIVVELDRPVAKVPTGETIVAIGGLQGSYAGNGFQQNQGGVSAFNSASSIGFGGSQGGVTGIASQGGLSGSGIIYSVSSTPATSIGFGGVQPTQGTVGVSRGVLSAGGFQQSQGRSVVSSTTPGPLGSPSSTTSAVFQQSQGATTISQGGGAQGGVIGAGFQQSQGSIYTATAAPRVQPTIPTPTVFIGGSNRGYNTGFQVQQGTTSSSQGGARGGSFGISYQGGPVYSATANSYLPPLTSTPSTVGFGVSNGGFSGSGIQQSQGAIGVSQQGGFAGIGIQQSQGGVGISQGGTQGAASYLPPVSSTPTVGFGISNGGFTGSGNQQSQGTFGVSQQGGFAGVGIQQSQGGVGISQGGTQGVGFQQSQGSIGISQGGSQGGFAGVGIQQSQGGISQGSGQGRFSGVGIQQSQGAVGVAQGSELSGAGFQQSQGGVIYSTTAAPTVVSQGPILLRPQQPVLSTTTTGPIIVSSTPVQQASNSGNNVVVSANTNVQSRGTVSSTTTTERSFSVSQDASAYASGSSAGSVQAASNNITPYMITVGEPDFQYPPYVEISSHGSPLGHLQQQPFARVQAGSHDYPRMRYQGQLLTGEVNTDDGHGYGAFSPNAQQNLHESPAYVAEIPPHISEEPQTEYQSGNQHEHNFVGSTKQPIQVSQTSSSPNQQPAQVYQHHFLRALSQPIVIAGNHQQFASPNQQDSEQSIHRLRYESDTAPQQPDYVSPNPQHYYQYSHQHAAAVAQHPIQSSKYQNNPKEAYETSKQPNQPEQTYQQQQQFLNANEHPTHRNLVAEIRHQHLAPNAQKPAQDESQIHQQDPVPEAHLQSQHATDSQEYPIDAAEIQSSTHRQFLQPPISQQAQYKQNIAPTPRQPEPYNSGSRLYKQRIAPLKYTQLPVTSDTSSQHTTFLNRNPEQSVSLVKSQNIETPLEPESIEEETTVHSSTIESSTSGAIVSSTTHAPQQAEISSQPERQTLTPQQTQRQTYASVLVNSNPGILYAPTRHAASYHAPGHKHNTFRFSSSGSSLFSPNGRQIHLVHSQPLQQAYSQQTSLHSPSDVSGSKSHQFSINNGGIQAQIPISHQRQIKISTGSSSAPETIEPKQSPRHQTAARYQTISSTTPSTVIVNEHHKSRGHKYRNEQTHGAITLRSGRTYGEHRIIASTPAPSDGSAASESVQTRRIVVNHPFQTVQEVVEQEPITKVHQVTVNEPSQLYQGDGPQQGQLNASYRKPAAYKVEAA